MEVGIKQFQVLLLLKISKYIWHVLWFDVVSVDGKWKVAEEPITVKMIYDFLK